MAISIGRLSGGNTPADGSDPRTFPAIWNTTADTLEGLEVGDLADATVTSPSFGQPLTYDPVSEQWVNDSGNYPVMVFSDSSARSSAIPSPSEGMVTFREDQDVVEVYDGSAFKTVGGLVAVKSALKTDTFTASVGAGGNVAVPDLSITHEVSDPANRLIISAFFGVAGHSLGRGNVGIAVNDGSGFIAVGDSAGSRVSVTAGGRISGDTSVTITTMPSVTYVHTPGAGSKTYSVHAFNITAASSNLFVNRTEGDGDAETTPRGVSSLVIQEVAV